MSHWSGVLPDPSTYSSREEYLVAVLPHSPVEEALQALALAEKTASAQAGHFAENFAHLLRIANEQYSDWSEEWKIAFVNAGQAIGYLEHC
eukprot:SAG22_NODE_9480_length_587_cov_1.758197_2_plen_90_part_01